MIKKISLKNKLIITWYANLFIIGCYIGSLIVFPILIKDLILLILAIGIIDYDIFITLNDLRLDTRTNKIFEKEGDEE